MSININLNNLLSKQNLNVDTVQIALKNLHKYGQEAGAHPDFFFSIYILGNWLILYKIEL